MQMDVARDVLVGVVIIWLGAASAWLWRAGRAYLKTRNRLEQQVAKLQEEVARLQHAVLVTVAMIESNDTAIGERLTVGPFAAHRQETNTMLERYEGNQTRAHEDLDTLRSEIDQLTTRLKNLEDDLAPVRAELALPDPIFSPATKAETAEALKSLRTGGVDTWPGPE
jgi:chromosome segregation ATPase